MTVIIVSQLQDSLLFAIVIFFEFEFEFKFGIFGTRNKWGQFPDENITFPSQSY